MDIARGLELVRAVIRKDAGAWWATHGAIWPKDRGAGLLCGAGNSNRKPEQAGVLRLNFLQRFVLTVVRHFLDLDLPIRIIALKPRQKGSTTWFSALVYWFMRFASTSACVIGGEYSQTDSIWKMLQTYLAYDDFDGWGNTGKIDEEKGVFSHGSQLRKETARDAKAGISGTFQLVLSTEVARWAAKGVANGAEVLANLLKCVPLLPRTFILLESTAEGDVGDFATRWKTAVDAEDFLSGKVALQPGQYVRVFAPWFEFGDSAIRLTAEQKRKIEATLDEDPEYAGPEGNREAELIAAYGQKDAETGVLRLGSGEDTKGFDVWEQLAWRRWAIAEECKRDADVFDQDYPHSWEAAFLKSGRPRFLARGIREMRKRAAGKTTDWGILDDTNEDMTHPAWRPVGEAEGVFCRWETPQPGLSYAVVIDTMTGASQTSGADPDCHSVLVRRNGYWRQSGTGEKVWVRPAIVARIKAGCRWDIDVLERQVWRLACYYGGGWCCRIVPEMNAEHGLVELLKLRGAMIYERRMFNQREQKETNALGWKTTPANRETIVDAVAKLIREWDKEGEGIDIWCGHILDECANFIRKESGRSEAADGWHDDDVICLGIGELTKEFATPCAEATTHRHQTTEKILQKDGFKLARAGVPGGVTRRRW